MRFHVRNEGTISIFDPLDERAEVWLEATSPKDATFMGKSLVVEHRYVEGVVLAINEAGGVFVP